MCAAHSLMHSLTYSNSQADSNLANRGLHTSTCTTMIEIGGRLGD